MPRTILLRDWLAAVVPGVGAGLAAVDVDLVLSRTIDRWQAGGAFLRGVSRQELAWLLARAVGDRRGG